MLERSNVRLIFSKCMPYSTTGLRGLVDTKYTIINKDL